MSFITKPIGRVLSPVFGMLFGSMKPPKMEAQRLGELSEQTSKEGEPRPIVYGIGRPIGGNIMYMSQPIKRMVKTYVGKSGGKGGGKKKKQYQDVEHVYRYYAIRVCEGPITGYRRIWRNGALVYDGRKGSAWGAKNNHLFFNTYRLYTGSWNQMPDSVLQSRQGMDIPAYRGTAYLVANNEDLTDFGGAIPQWQFEVVRSEGYYLTSRPYALEADEKFFERGLLPAQPAEPEKLTMVGLSVKSVKYIEDVVTHEAFSDIGLSVQSVQVIQDSAVLQNSEQVQTTANVIESTIDAADAPDIVYNLKSSVHIVSGDIE